MKFQAYSQITKTFGLLICLGTSACAVENKTTSTESSRVETCVNGVCTSTSQNTTTVTKNGSGNTTGVTIGNTDTNNGPVLVTVKVESSAGSLQLKPCVSSIAPISACEDAAGIDVMMPKHLGCTPTGANAWSCQDMLSGSPPYSVISCNNMFSSSCGVIGKIY